MRLPPISIRSLLIASLALGASSCVASARLDPSFRLIDLNRTGQSGLSPYFDPQSFVAAGGVVFFPAWSLSEGFELWRSDGTDAGTRILADLLPGSLSSSPAQLTPAGDSLYFLAADDSGAYEIFVSSPPTFTPTRLTNFDLAVAGTPAIVGVAGASPGTLIYTYPAEGLLGLWAVRGPGNAGPAQPPSLLRAFASGPLGATFGGTDVVAHGGDLFFAADDGIHGRELWRTDGTITGTAIVTDLVPGPQGSNPTAVTAFDGRILLSASSPGHGAEPWVFDPAGARQLMDVDSPAEPALGSSPSGFVEFNGRIFFSAHTAESGRELWVTDGSANPAATQLLRDINPGPASGLDAAFQSAIVSGRLYFAADDGVHGAELWSTDGSATGTRLEAELRPGAVGSNPAGLLVFEGSLIFQVARDDAGSRLWRGRLDNAGSLIVEQISDLPFSEDDAINRLAQRPCVALPGQLMFPAFRTDCGLELFRSDGLSEATLVKDIRTGTATSAPGQFARLGRSVLLSARNEFGAEPWVSDGSREGTRLLADLVPGRAGSNPASLLSGRDFAIFRATTAGTTGWWRTDGPASGSSGTSVSGVASLDVFEPMQSAAPRAAALGGLMVFAGRTNASGDEPFVTDGHETRLLLDIAPGTRGSSPFCFFRLGPRIIFFASTVPGTVELWSTDGTPDNTQPFATIINPLQPRVVSTAVRPVVAGDYLFFVASDGSGDELWATAGDELSTRMVTDLIPGPRGSSPTGLCASQTSGNQWRVFFAATDDQAGTELWICQPGDAPGAPLDAHRVRDIAPGPASSAPFTLTSEPYSGSGLVYFVATDGLGGFELWVSDGSEAGTRALTHIGSVGEASVQAVLGVAGPRVYMRIVDPGFTSFSGQLYLADDSSRGASPVINAAGEPIVPTSAMFRVNSRAFLAVSDRTLGNELGIIDLCPADFDNSGAVGVDDLFSFLGAWIPRVGRVEPAQTTDLSGDGAVSVDDLFLFLSAYFTGCA